MYRKVYIEVTTKMDTNGTITPLAIRWENDMVYDIDRVLDVRRAACPAGGAGWRFTCKICGKERFLYLEGTRWSVAVPD